MAAAKTVDDMEMFEGIDEVAEKTPKLGDFLGDYVLEVRKIANHPRGPGFNARTQADFKVLESTNESLSTGAPVGHAIWKNEDYGYHREPILNLLASVLGTSGEKITPKDAVAVLKDPETPGQKLRARVFQDSKKKKNGTVWEGTTVRFAPFNPEKG